MKIKAIAIIVVLLPGCDSARLSEVEKLPPVTHKGRNTFACLVNGIAWVTPTQGDAAAFYGDSALAICARIKKPNLYQSFGFIIDTADLSKGTYTLDQPSHRYGVYEDATTKCYYTSTKGGSGELIVENVDRKNGIVSGTFWMTLRTRDCDTIKITNGRFDLTYRPSQESARDNSLASLEQ